MKVVHILNSDKFSGAERVAILIIHCLYQQGILMLLAIHGIPLAIASIKATGSPSLFDGNANKSPIHKISLMSLQKPNKKTCFSNPRTVDAM